MIAACIAALLNAYVGEPILVYLGIYRLIHWSYFRSFVVLLLIAIVVKALADWIGRQTAGAYT